MSVSGRDGLTMYETILIDAGVGRIPIGGFHIAPTVSFYVPACLGVARGLIIGVFSAPRLRRLNRCRVDDINAPFSHDDVFCFRLTVHFAQQNTPQPCSTNCWQKRLLVVASSPSLPNSKRQIFLNNKSRNRVCASSASLKRSQIPSREARSKVSN